MIYLFDNELIITLSRIVADRRTFIEAWTVVVGVSDENIDDEGPGPRGPAPVRRLEGDDVALGRLPVQTLHQSQPDVLGPVYLVSHLRPVVD